VSVVVVSGGVVDPNVVIDKSISLMGEHRPYRVRKDIAGNSVVVFNEHFLYGVREAMSNGCVQSLGEVESAFWYKFVEFQNDVQDGVRDNPDKDADVEVALNALNEWVVVELAGGEHLSSSCYTVGI